MLQEQLTKWFSRPVLDWSTNCSVLIPAALSSDIGRSRKENQDRVAMLRVSAGSMKQDSFSVIALADGMGGMSDGSACASLTISSFFYALIKNRHQSAEHQLDIATRYADKTVFDFSNGRGGSTLSAVLATARHESYFANIGDSRIYAIHEGASTVSRLTTDDSLEAMGGHGRGLLQFVGMGEGLQPHINSITDLESRILLTSDGIHFISNETLSEIFLHAEESEQVAQRLLAVARWCGGPDNASLGVTKLKPFLESLSSSTQASIEVWDPFGSAQFMWVKDNPFVQDYSRPSNSTAENKPEPTLPSAVEATDKIPPKKKPKKPRKQSNTSKPRKKVAPAPLLEIEEDIEDPRTEVKRK